MNSDALTVLYMIFEVCWRFFTSWTVPGTNITIGTFLLFLLFVSLAIRFIKRFFDNSNSDS